MTDPLIWNAAIKAAGNAVRIRLLRLDEGDPAFEELKDELECTDAAIHRLAKSAPDLREVVAGMVVPLEWEEGTFYRQPAFYADSPLGCWMVVQFSSRKGRWSYENSKGKCFEEDWDAPEAAKAAAEAHRIRCILAELGLEGGE